jgi:DNA-binding CsgD family transcriptional regulator
MSADLIDRIYECSFLPERWPGVLDELAGLVDAQGGLMFAVRDQTVNWTSSLSIRPIFQSYFNDGWFARCNRQRVLFSRSDPTFLVEHDFWTHGELEVSPIYRDFFYPHGLGWSAGTALMMPSGDRVVFSVERAYQRGPMEADLVSLLNNLRAHLARAALISSRLDLQNAKSAADMLATIGLPAVILDENGFAIDANALMVEQADVVPWQTQQRFALRDTCSNDLLRAALLTLNRPNQRAVQSFPLRGAEGHAAMVIHVVPVQRCALNIFGRSHALLIMTPISARRSPPFELLCAMFDLTPSEARVARSLATGDSLDDIAASGGVSRNTVRCQLQHVLQKVGCSRQAEATALLSNMALGQGEK